VIGLGAIGGVLAYLLTAVPAIFDALAFKATIPTIWRGLTLPLARLGVPNILFGIVVSALLGALVATMRLGIGNAVLLLLAGLLFGLVVRTGIALGLIRPLLGGALQLDFPCSSGPKSCC
jgi:hypothetical protein